MANANAIAKPSGMPESAWAEYQGKSGTSINPEYNTTINPDDLTIKASGDKPAQASTTPKLTIDKSAYGVENNVGYYQANKADTATEVTEKKPTGSGLEAAVGEGVKDYSWNTKAQALAEKNYSQKILEDKANLLTNRQTIEQNAQQYQTEADMKKYSDNQAGDKVGWTGGYVLDQNRQQEYLKASIQAQLYGALELQKYGYDTSLAAARLAYDSNLLTYANEYYNQAVQNSLNEAQVTGTYFSAEVSEMLGQLKVAEAKLAENENDTQAQKVRDTISNWFSSSGVSTEGVKILRALEAERNANYEWSHELWTRYQAALDLANQNANETTTYIMLDADGNFMYDGNAVKTVNMNNWNDSDIASYASSSDSAKTQVTSYFRYLKESAKQECSKTDSSGNVTYDTEALNKKYAEIQNRIDAINNALQEDINEYNKDEKNKDTQKKFNPIDVGIVRVGNKTGDKDDNIPDLSRYTKEDALKAAKERIASLNASGIATSNNIISVKDSKETDFGTHSGTGHADRAQSAWVNILIDLAKEGQIPDGTIVNMDVGFEGSNSKYYYCYMLGHWVQVDTASNHEAEKLRNNAVVAGTNWSKTWDDILAEKLSYIKNNITGVALDGTALVNAYKTKHGITNNLT